MKKLKYLFVFGIILAAAFFIGKDKIMQKAQVLRLEFLSEMKEAAMIEDVPFIKQNSINYYFTDTPLIIVPFFLLVC